MCACHLVNPARLSQPSRVGQGHLCPALEPSLPTRVSPWVTRSFLLCHLTSPPCYNEVSPVSILYNWCCLCLITKSFQPKCLCHHCPSLYYFPCPVPISCPTSIPTLHAFLMFIYSIFLSTYLLRACAGSVRRGRPCLYPSFPWSYLGPKLQRESSLGF